MVCALVGELALERADPLSGRKPVLAGEPLTDRQIECALWTARGKTDWEISRILGISKLTVSQHQKMIRERYDVSSRTALAMRALFEGHFSFCDIFRSRSR